MAKAPGESKIPVLHSNQLRSRLSSISNKVRSHLDGSYRSSSSSSSAAAPSVLFGLFGGPSSSSAGGDSTKDAAAPPLPPPQQHSTPVRPSSLFDVVPEDCCAAVAVPKVTEKDVGSRVQLTRHSATTGVLRYIGKTVLGAGDWCGVEVDGGHGVCDGSVRGVRYFTCRDRCALFVLAHLVVRVASPDDDDGDGGDAAGTTERGGGGGWDVAKTESPFECNDSLGILTPDQMLEFGGEEASCAEVPCLFFAATSSPRHHQLLADCISDGDVTMNDLEAISMPKDDDLVSPALSSDPSNHTVSEHDSVSAYPKRSTVSFGNVFYDNFTIDRTPSLEDLPMDDLSSKTTTEAPLPNVPSVNAVITSITSVCSLDTGYQGDGETSRPTSRGATVKRLGPTEPMTDSDFFTESEAEDHCHRKARVIDGTLYSGDSIPETQQDNCKSSGTTVEEMDSSGVYSDFDKIFEEPPVHKHSSEAISSNNSTSPSSVNSQQIHSTEVDHQPSSTTIIEISEDASSPASKRCKRPTSAKPKTLDVRQDQENRTPRTRKPAGRWDAVMNKIEKSKTDQKCRVNRLKDVKSKINSINLLATPCTNRLKESPTNSEPLPVRSHRENTPLKTKSRRTRARGGSESNLPLSDQKANTSTPRCILKSSQNSSRDSSFSELSGETKITLKQAISHPSLSNKNVRGSPSSSVHAVVPTVRKLVASSTNGSPSKGGGRCPQNRRLNSDHNLTATTKSTDGNGKTTASQNNPPAPSQAAVVPRSAAAATAAVAGPAQQVSRVVKVTKKDATASPAVDHRHHRGHQQQLHRDAQRLLRAENQLRHVTKGFDAISVLLRYLVDDMDAMSTAKLKRQLDANRDDLMSAKRSLDESQAKCVQYEENIDKLQKENEKYRIDLDAKEKLVIEITLSKETKVWELEKKLLEQSDCLQAQFDEELNKLKNESEEEKMKLILSHDQKVVELQQINKLEVQQIHKLTAEKQIEFEEKMSVLKNECDRLKSERDALKEENCSLFEDKKLQNTSMGYQKLCSEIESLRTVLELKSSEMQELRKQNERLQREVDEVPSIIQKYEAAQSRVEDLNVQLQKKSEIEMQLSLEKDKMAREIDLEKQKKKRLSCHNEELQWKLKKSTEVANHLAVTTKRMSQTPQDLAAMKEAQTNYQKLRRESSNSDNSGEDDNTVTSQLEVDSEAPAKIMGVMMKNDSLSYVFEVEEEPSEIAMRLVRRASSLRSVGKSRIRARETIGEKRSRASSQSSSTKSVELDANRNLDDIFAMNAADRYSSDCYTCSSHSSNSSPEHMVYDQTHTTSYSATAHQAGNEKTGNGDGLAI